jgi:hypothetical protein
MPFLYLAADAGASGDGAAVVDDESDGGAGVPGAPAGPGGPAGPGAGAGTTVVEDGAGAVVVPGGFTTVVLRSQALSAAAAAINTAICMSLLFIGSPGI